MGVCVRHFTKSYFPIGRRGVYSSGLLLLVHTETLRVEYVFTVFTLRPVFAVNTYSLFSRGSGETLNTTPVNTSRDPRAPRVPERALTGAEFFFPSGRTLRFLPISGGGGEVAEPEAATEEGRSPRVGKHDGSRFCEYVRGQFLECF